MSIEIKHRWTGAGQARGGAGEARNCARGAGMSDTPTLTLPGLVGAIAEAGRRYVSTRSVVIRLSAGINGADFDAVYALPGATLRSTVYSPHGSTTEPYVIEVAVANLGSVELEAQRSRKATAKEARQLDEGGAHKHRDEFVAARLPGEDG